MISYRKNFRLFLPCVRVPHKYTPIVSCDDGVLRLSDKGEYIPLYDMKKYNIKHANDMKVGPDKRIYVGTQSEKRLGISDSIDGKLYVIDKSGEVDILLDNLSLSNGMEWSLNEKLFYHTDSDTEIIKEYKFIPQCKNIVFTGREIIVPGVDGFTVGNDNKLYVACWGYGHIAIIDTKMMTICKYIDLPCKITASCGFGGENMEMFTVTTASYGLDNDKCINDGYTIIGEIKSENKTVTGRKPYLFEVE